MYASVSYFFFSSRMSPVNTVCRVNNSPKWNGFRLELSTSLWFMHIDRVNSMALKKAI